MQDIDPPSSEQLLAIGQRPLAKVEIWDDVEEDWINLCNLGGKNYVQDISISLGGASMTPQPVEGTWSAVIKNEDGVFHPDHPTSLYKDYLQTERLTKISIGAIYGGVPRIYQRVIGYMNMPEFSAPDYTVTISGGDYMKRLRETELRFPDNYWGVFETFSSISSDGIISAETYDEDDAMTIVPNEVDDIPVAWVRTLCAFNSVVDNRPGSAGNRAGSVTGQGPGRPVNVHNLNVSAGVEGNSYQFKFWHRIVGGTGLIGIRLYIMQDAGTCFHAIYFPTDDWTEETFEFTARDNTALQWWFRLAPVVCDLRLDDFSIKSYKFYYDRYYDITDANEKGPYRVTLTLINNGGFVANVDEWTAVAANLTNVAGGQDGNCMQVASSGADLGKAYQDITTVIGNTYKLSLYFKKGTSATGKFMIGIVADEDSIYDSGALSDATWTAYSHSFVVTATTTRITMQTTEPTADKNSLFDEIILGPEDVWQAEEDEGWWYEEATGHVFFDINKVVATGVDNLRIYYFMTTPIEEVLASLLFQAGVPDTNGDLYVNEAALLTAIRDADEYAPPNIDIDKAWFEPGTTCLNAVKKICERCNYRFYFKYDGTPIFRPKPAADAALFTFTDPKHIASAKTYQDQGEIKNRIVIQGMKRTSPINRDDTVPSEFKGELADDAVGGSIDLYGERTLTIKNHLFQDDDSINNAVTGMCKILLDEYKLPKWYADLEMPFLPVPLDLGDNIKWEERLSPTLDIVPSPEGIIRDMKIDNYNTTYKCVKK